MLDVGQCAHGERQAAGQIGAVAVAQCHSPAHDVVAEPCQVASVHADIMTHQNGNVEPTSPFHSLRRMNSGYYFLETPARSILSWAIVAQNISSIPSMDRPTTSTLGTPSSRRTTVASGNARPRAGLDFPLPPAVVTKLTRKMLPYR